MNIAEYQNIVVRQYLPATIGVPLLPYFNENNVSSYNSTTDPAVDLLFASAAFRYGHSEIMPYFPRIGADLKEIPAGSIPLRGSFFNPMKQYVEDPDYGIYEIPAEQNPTDEPLRVGPAVVALLRGLSHARSGAVEPILIEEMRNFVFSSGPTKPGIDLFSVGLQMCRDQELGSFNDARRLLGLTPATTWSQISSVPHIRRAISSIYASPEEVDVWTGMLAEDRANNAAVGPTAAAIIFDQFARARNADRLWFENGLFTEKELSRIYAVTLGKLVERNYPLHVNRTATGTDTKIDTQFPANSFFLPDRQFSSYQASSIGAKVFFPSPPVKVDRTLDLSPVFRVSWAVHGNGSVVFVLQGKFSGWMGMGIGAEPGTMKGADIVLCRLLDPENSTSTHHECRDSFALDIGTPTLDSTIGGSNDIKYSEAFLDDEFQFALNPLCSSLSMLISAL